MQKFVRRVVRPLVFSTLVSLNALVGVTANAVTVLSGSGDLLDSNGPANGGVTGFSSGRPSSSGFASLFIFPPQPYPGTFGVGTNVRFDAYTISFAPNANQPVFYDIRFTTGLNNPQSDAYLDSFDPMDVSTNWLGNNGGPGVDNLYQVIVPAGQPCSGIF